MARLDLHLRHLGIFGRRLSGKTTAAREWLRASWEREHRFSLVCDPNLETWGPHAWVTDDVERWLHKLDGSLNCNVACDEAGMTIKRDRELIDLFTRIGHKGHRLIVMGHSGTNLLPVMREQLTEVILFRQSQNEAKIWAELFADDRILEACGLAYDRHEFLHAVLGGAVRRCVLRLPQHA